MKILITGGRGFIGSHFHKRFIDDDVTIVDLLDGNDALDFFRDSNAKFDLVIHCAAIVGGRKTIDGSPAKLFGNFALDSEMLMWALKTKPRKVVYFSSSAAYPNSLQQEKDFYTGENNKYRLKESDIDLNDMKNADPSVYGLSKLVGEHLIQYVQDEIDVWIFRPFSGYSELQSLDYPFPSFIARAARQDDPFEIWGPTGLQSRDWVHIDDIIEFTLRALEHDPDVYNICTGVPTSFNEFAEIVTSMVGYKPKFNRILSAPVGVQYRVGDPTKQNKIYVPRISLEEGIKRALMI